MSKKNVLYYRQNAEWLEIAIAFETEEPFCMRTQDVSDASSLIVALAKQFDACVGPDVSPRFDNMSLLLNLKARGWRDWWLYPVHSDSPNKIGWYSTVKSNATIFGAFDPLTANWHIVCSEIARYMYQTQVEPVHA